MSQIEYPTDELANWSRDNYVRQTEYNLPDIDPKIDLGPWNYFRYSGLDLKHRGLPSRTLASAWEQDQLGADHKPTEKWLANKTARKYFGLNNEWAFNAISEQEFNENFENSDVKWNPDMTWGQALMISSAKQYEKEIYRGLNMSEGGWGRMAADFFVQMPLELTDPVNLAATLVVPEVKLAQKILGPAAKMTTRRKLLQAGMAGAIGNAAVEPFIAVANQYRQTEYGVLDSAASIGGGFFLGAGLRSIPWMYRGAQNAFGTAASALPDMDVGTTLGRGVSALQKMGETAKEKAVMSRVRELIQDRADPEKIKAVLDDPVFIDNMLKAVSDIDDAKKVLYSTYADDFDDQDDFFDFLQRNQNDIHDRLVIFSKNKDGEIPEGIDDFIFSEDVDPRLIEMVEGITQSTVGNRKSLTGLIAQIYKLHEDYGLMSELKSGRKVPTRLSPAAFHAVRTDEFKAQFGDWNQERSTPLIRRHKDTQEPKEFKTDKGWIDVEEALGGEDLSIKLQPETAKRIKEQIREYARQVKLDEMKDWIDRTVAIKELEDLKFTQEADFSEKSWLRGETTSSENVQALTRHNAEVEKNLVDNNAVETSEIIQAEKTPETKVKEEEAPVEVEEPLVEAEAPPAEAEAPAEGVKAPILNPIQRAFNNSEIWKWQPKASYHDFIQSIEVLGDDFTFAGDNVVKDILTLIQDAIKDPTLGLAKADSETQQQWNLLYRTATIFKTLPGMKNVKVIVSKKKTANGDLAWATPSKVVINPKFFTTQGSLDASFDSISFAETFLHELTHSATLTQFDTFFNFKNGGFKKEEYFDALYAFVYPEANKDKRYNLDKLVDEFVMDGILGVDEKIAWKNARTNTQKAKAIQKWLGPVQDIARVYLDVIEDLSDPDRNSLSAVLPHLDDFREIIKENYADPDTPMGGTSAWLKKQHEEGIPLTNKGRTLYKIGDLDEFIANALSEADWQTFLSNMTYNDVSMFRGKWVGAYSDQSVLKTIRDIVSNLISNTISRSSESVSAAEVTRFSILEMNKSGVFDNIETPKGSGRASSLRDMDDEERAAFDRFLEEREADKSSSLEEKLAEIEEQAEANGYDLNDPFVEDLKNTAIKEHQAKFDDYQRKKELEPEEDDFEARDRTYKELDEEEQYLLNQYMEEEEAKRGIEALVRENLNKSSEAKGAAGLESSIEDQIDNLNRASSIGGAEETTSGPSRPITSGLKKVRLKAGSNDKLKSVKKKLIQQANKSLVDAIKAEVAFDNGRINEEELNGIVFRHLDARRRALLDLQVYEDFQKKIGDSPNVFEAIKLYINGGMGVSGLDQRSKALQREMSGELMSKLKENKLDEDFLSDKYEEQIYHAMALLDQAEEKVPVGDTLAVLPEKAVQIAKVIRNVRLKQLATLNMMGGSVQMAKNHARVRRHSPERILRGTHKRSLGRLHTPEMAVDQWVDFVLSNNLNKDLTFGYTKVSGSEWHFNPDQGLGLWITKRVANENKISQKKAKASLGQTGGYIIKDKSQLEQYEREFLSDLCHRILDPQRQSSNQNANVLLGSHDEMGLERTLVFRDWKDNFNYDKQYSGRSFAEGTILDITNKAKGMAMMEFFGSHEGKVFQKISDAYSEEIRAGRKSSKNPLERLGKVDHHSYFDQITGELDNPENHTLSRLSGVIRSFLIMGQLEQAAISSLADLASFNSTMRANGIAKISQLGSDIARMDAMDPDVKLFLTQTGAGAEQWLGEAARRFGYNEHVPGMASNLQKLFFKVNGMNAWNKFNQSRTILNLSSNLAQSAGKAYDDLNPRLRASLSKYGITPDDWDALRISTRSVDSSLGGESISSGLKYLTLDSIDGANRDVLLNNASKSGLSLSRYKRNLKQKLMTYYSDQMDHSVLMPGNWEMTNLHLGTKSGTMTGTVTRFLSLYKAFGLTVLSKIGSREIAWTMGGGGFLSLVAYLGQATVMGFIVGAIKDILNNRTPDPDVLRSIKRSGVTGMIGDAVLGEYYAQEKSLAGNGLSNFGSYMAGPLLNIAFRMTAAGDEMLNAGHTYSVPSKGQEGWTATLREHTPAYTYTKKESRGQRMMFQTIKDNLPFMDLPLTGMALDVLMWDDISNAIDKGYLGRREWALNKKGQQTLYKHWQD